VVFTTGGFALAARRVDLLQHVASSTTVAARALSFVVGSRLPTMDELTSLTGPPLGAPRAVGAYAARTLWRARTVALAAGR